MDIKDTARAYAQNPDLAQEGERAMQALLARSATDLDFRQRLLTDAPAALAEFTGRPVPAGTNVVFIENKADATIVLPDPVRAEAELSEEELEAVAGGDIVTTLSLTAAIITSAVLVSQGVKTIGDDDAWTS